MQRKSQKERKEGETKANQSQEKNTIGTQKDENTTDFNQKLWKL